MPPARLEPEAAYATSFKLNTCCHHCDAITAAPQAISDNYPLPREWQTAIESLHQELQRELAESSLNSKHIVARKAGHNIQLDEPALVLDAITELVTNARP